MAGFLCDILLLQLVIFLAPWTADDKTPTVPMSATPDGASESILHHAGVRSTSGSSLSPW